MSNKCDDRTTEELTFTILVDPPGRNEMASDELLFTLKAWADLLQSIDPDQPADERILGNFCRALYPSLWLITKELMYRIDLPDLDEAVRKQIAEEWQKTHPHQGPELVGGAA